MHGLIPAAGRGTRLRPFTRDRPKALVEIDGRPLLEYCFEALAEIGVEEYIVVIGYLGEQIRERYGQQLDGRPITYVNQSEPRGLGHAIGLAREAVSGPVVIMHGDNVIRADLDPAVETFHSEGVDGVLLVEQTTIERARDTGVVRHAEDGTVAGMVEKPDTPPTRLVSAGVGVFSPAVLDLCADLGPSPDTGEIEFSTAVDRFVSRGGTIVSHELNGWRINVNTPADRRRAERRLASSQGA